MVQYYKTYELKDRAKDALRGNYRLTISVFLLFLLIRVGVNLLISSLATPFLTISVFFPIFLRYRLLLGLFYFWTGILHAKACL